VTTFGETEKSEKGIEKILEEIRTKYDDFRDYGEKCPDCRKTTTFAYNIQDRAFSIHYIDDVADFVCSNCGFKWSGQYGYKGVA
jgi:transposase-like protein